MARGTCSVCHAEYPGDVRFCPRDGAAIVEQPSDDAVIGTTIDGRYFIRRLIGRGGMGVVYEADHVGLDKRVAIKFMLDVDREMIARFRREARAAARIEHENVVQIFDVGTTAGGGEFIVMEYLDGRDLGGVLKEGALPAARALAIVRQILHGLHAIHEAGIVHRDIKPANILLVGDDDLVKIMDFGISAMDIPHHEALTRRGQVVGTPQFMAPEQLAGGPVDRRADIYAVALTLHAMLTGKMPYTATSVEAIATQQLVGPPELDVAALGIQAHVADALRNALSRAPADRYSTALELAAALDGTLPRDPMARTAAAKRVRLAAKPSPGDAPTVVERPSSSARSGASGRRWIVVGAVAIALAAIAVFTFFATRPTTPASHATSDAAAVAIDPLAAARAAEHDGKLDIAVARYLEAFAAKQDPELLFRVGELYERLDRAPDAIHYFENYLERSLGAKDRDAVVARIARLRPAPLVDAGAADAAPQIAIQRSAPKPDPRCHCIHNPDGVNTSWLCPKKQLPVCFCAKGSDGLCPTPYEKCPGTGDCPKLAITNNNGRWSCSIGAPRGWWKTDVVPGEGCQGYSTAMLPKGDKPYEPKLVDGKWDCTYCYGPLDTPKEVLMNRFAVPGKPGDECSGYLVLTGERKAGHVECKDKWW